MNVGKFQSPALVISGCLADPYLCRLLRLRSRVSLRARLHLLCAEARVPCIRGNRRRCRRHPLDRAGRIFQPVPLAHSHSTLRGRIRHHCAVLPWSCAPHNPATAHTHAFTRSTTTLPPARLMINVWTLYRPPPYASRGKLKWWPNLKQKYLFFQILPRYIYIYISIKSKIFL